MQAQPRTCQPLHERVHRDHLDVAGTPWIDKTRWAVRRPRGHQVRAVLVAGAPKPGGIEVVELLQRLPDNVRRHVLDLGVCAMWCM
jgi:hypothetical protein